MRTLFHILGASLVLASCKTPPPARQDSFEDDEVIVESEPDEPPDMGTPDVAVAQPEPEDKTVEKPDDPHQTFVVEPTLPDDMSFQEMALARTIEQTRAPLVFAPVIEGSRCGIPTAIHASAGEGSGFTVDSCARVIAAAHAKTNQRTLSQLGVIDASMVEIRHDGEVVWSVAPVCIDLRQDETACKTDFVVRVPTIASFVGPLLSYEVRTAQARAGKPSRSDYAGYVSDVRTGKPAKFGAMIDEDSLIDGLKRNSFMRRAVNPVELDKAKTLDEIWTLWRTQDFGFFGAYYFAKWDAENGLVEMRIWYREDTVDEQANELKELSVWVRPKRTWSAAFEDAATGKSGFLAR